MRRHGTRNAGYEQRRAELLDRITERLCDREVGWPTLRELAAAAGCSVSTLKHYFGRRDQIVAAALHRVAAQHVAWRERTRLPQGEFVESIHGAAETATEALYSPFISRLVAMGFVEALGSGPINLFEVARAT
ncbi:hypothetical protein [Paracoccus sp. S1E-3]|uniref:hypothetical protein n=1 Tax=Paracoccus sp. S1E-3 TaxID=2756130 RepID=UPI0015EF686F|nr:hypothetical protein [Paracoccus sp. S1E-3]MBA4491603.1 hypothetical protein [Paracoccus sp. S1E-3]